jgi:hypothetical protein
MKHLKIEYGAAMQARGLRQILNRDVNIVCRFRQRTGAVVNALIHLALPCHRHIDRLRRGHAGIAATHGAVPRGWDVIKCLNYLMK